MFSTIGVRRRVGRQPPKTTSPRAVRRAKASEGPWALRDEGFLCSGPAERSRDERDRLQDQSADGPAGSSQPRVRSGAEPAQHEHHSPRPGPRPQASQHPSPCHQPHRSRPTRTGSPTTSRSASDLGCAQGDCSRAHSSSDGLGSPRTATAPLLKAPRASARKHRGTISPFGGGWSGETARVATDRQRYRGGAAPRTWLTKKTPRSWPTALESSGGRNPATTCTGSPPCGMTRFSSSTITSGSRRARYSPGHIVANSSPSLRTSQI